jgi:hypothetical protein
MATGIVYILLTKSKKNLPSLTNKGVLSADDLWTYVGFRAGCEAPRARAKGFVEHTAIFDFRKVD